MENASLLLFFSLFVTLSQLVVCAHPNSFLRKLEKHVADGGDFYRMIRFRLPRQENPSESILQAEMTYPIPLNVSRRLWVSVESALNGSSCTSDRTPILTTVRGGGGSIAREFPHKISGISVCQLRGSVHPRTEGGTTGADCIGERVVSLLIKNFFFCGLCLCGTDMVHKEKRRNTSSKRISQTSTGLWCHATSTAPVAVLGEA